MNNNENPIPTMFGGNEDDYQDNGQQVNEPDIREELIILAEGGDINYTTKQIRKANRATLERIKRDYLRKQTNETNELITDSIITKFSELLDNLEMIDESDDLEKELQDSKLLKRDLKNIIGHITPYIPLVGLLCGGVILLANMYLNQNQTRLLLYMKNKVQHSNIQRKSSFLRPILGKYIYIVY